MYQQATEILPFAATLWKDVKFNEIHLHALFLCVSMIPSIFFCLVIVLVVSFCCFCLLHCVEFRFDCPLSISQFLMFELAQNGISATVQDIMAKSQDIGVDLEDFLNTLLGK